MSPNTIKKMYTCRQYFYESDTVYIEKVDPHKKTKNGPFFSHSYIF